MRVAVISDIHGNLPALEAVLSDVSRERVDRIISCGDVASGPLPVETLQVLRGLADARFVRGNADPAQRYGGEFATTGTHATWKGWDSTGALIFESSDAGQTTLYGQVGHEFNGAFFPG